MRKIAKMQISLLRSESARSGGHSHCADGTEYGLPSWSITEARRHKATQGYSELARPGVFFGGLTTTVMMVEDSGEKTNVHG